MTEQIDTPRPESKEIPEGRTVNIGGLASVVGKGYWIEAYENGRIEQACDRLVKLFEDTAQNNPELDFLLGPEYLLYADPSLYQPLTFKESKNGLLISSGDGNIKRVVDQLRTLAKEKQITIVPGTLCETAKINGKDAQFNTAIVIDPNGNIISRRRKTTGTDSPTYFKKDIDEVSSAMSTIEPTTVTSKSGDQYSFAVAICAEKGDPTFYKALASKLSEKLDLLAIPVRESSDNQYRKKTEKLNIENMESSVESARQREIERAKKNVNSGMQRLEEAIKYVSEVEIAGREKGAEAWVASQKEGVKIWKAILQRLEDNPNIYPEPVTLLAEESGVLQPKGAVLGVDGSTDIGVLPATKSAQFTNLDIEGDLVKATCIF